MQVALAHRCQSHPQSPPSSNKGRVTFQLCRNRTLQLCGYKQSGVMHVMELKYPFNYNDLIFSLYL
ncbi:hypothetical protein ELI54_35595 [Rhizobium ruizarguesonis]|nr:hypothetical protein [Rhizobium leguminosarum bv. viciae]NKQ72419.1 hypothetical protein [Rhizobium ruizarguesonis]NKL40336.1 hypothetical protein [Rhizobium leguminosarum bv. viciae]TAT70797.1 hypothetical protein ELI56_35520 [Rhizobium ruizarguesonis]TAT74110.1 hypothetical protein ELI54_35595 [Rhizobium ruizarguesonis]